MLVADNQLNRIFDYDATGEPIGEALTGVSVRPTALDLFGTELLAAALAEHDGPVVHLGDAVDIGCLDEFESFLELMTAAERPWAFTPGNHDMTYRGNFHDTSPDGDWVRACSGPDAGATAAGVLTKDRMVRMYLDALQRCSGACSTPGLEASAASGVWQSPDPDAFLRRIAWSIDEARPWRSWVVQEVKVPGAADGRMILVDTNSWVRSPPQRVGDLDPSSLGWTTFWGTVSPPVRSMVEGWVQECSITEGCSSILAGHHPFGYFGGVQLGSLDEGDRRWLRGVMKRGPRPPLMYVSAHTHDGFLELREPRSGGFYELNVQSVLDPPPGYRRLWMDRVRCDSGEAGDCVQLESSIVQLARRWDAWGCSATLEVRRDFHIEYHDYTSRADYHRNRLRQSLDLVARLIRHLAAAPGPYRALADDADVLRDEVASAPGAEALSRLDAPVRALVAREPSLASEAEIDMDERRRARRCIALTASLSEAALDPYARFRLIRSR